MSNFRIGLAGALVGALLVLLVHPVTRPFVQNGLWRFGESPASKSSPVISQNLEFLPEAQDTVTAALWITEGFRQLSANKTLEATDLLTLVEIAQASADREPNNAFWKQAEAVYQAELGNDEASLRAWRQAARLDVWDDYQNQRLRSFIGDLSAEDGRQLGWHWAVAQRIKTDVNATAIALYGLQTIRSEPNLTTRYELMKNGLLVRDGARSRGGGNMGWQMIESGALGSSTGLGSKREFIARRFAFIDQLAQAEMTDEATLASSILATNEAWDAALTGIDKETKPQSLAKQVVIVDSLPGSLLMAAFVSLLVYGLGCIFKEGLAKFSQNWVIPAIASIVVGLGTYLVTGLLFPATFLSLVLAAFLIRPRVTPLSGKSFSLDLWMRTATIVIGLLFVGTATAVAVLQSLPVQTLNRFTEPTITDIFRPAIGTTLALIFLGAVIGLAQVWAYARRRDPFVAVGLALKDLGLTGMVTGVTLGIIACPFSITLDREISRVLSQLVLNEPTYYLQNL